MTLYEIVLVTFLGIVPIVLLVAVLVYTGSSVNILYQITLLRITYTYFSLFFCILIVGGSGDTTKERIISAILILATISVVLWSTNTIRNLFRDEYGKKYITKTARIERIFGMTFDGTRGGAINGIKLFDDINKYKYKEWGENTKDIDVNSDDDYDKVFYEFKILPNSKIILEAKVLPKR